MRRPSFLFLCCACLAISGLACVAVVVSAGAQASPQSATPAPAAPQAQRPDPVMQQGIQAFQKGDYPGGLTFFKQVIAADPKNTVAYNLAGNCALNLKDYPSAANDFQYALQLQPDEFHNLSGLMRAYTLAGRAQDRDALRKHIDALEQDKKLPPNFNFVFDSFELNGKHVEISYFPQIAGFYGDRYTFAIFDAAATQQTARITLESAQFDQQYWAKQHPDLAAAGQREFSLDGFQGNMHSTFRFYDGEPSLDQVRGDVEAILGGKMRAMSSTTRGPVPTAAPANNQTQPAGQSPH